MTFEFESFFREIKPYITDEEAMILIVGSISDVRDTLPLSTPEKTLEYLLFIIDEIEKTINRTGREIERYDD